MKTITRSLIVVALVMLILAVPLLAQPHYALLAVEVPVDASVASDLIVTPDTIMAQALRPGDQAAYDVTVENRGVITCKDIFATQRETSEYLTIQTWPTGALAPTESAEVRVILTVSEDAPDLTTLSLGLGLICVQ